MTRFVLEHSDFSPYEIINPDGSAPVLVACDHADNRIPLSLHGLGLDPVHLENHIAYDIGAREVALKLSRLFDAPLLLANYSRLVVDLNRHLDDPTLLVEQSDGIDIPGNQNLDAEKRDQRVRNYFQPYHDQYACMVSRLAAHHKSPMILAIHSFTPTFNGYLRPWDFGVLWDQSEELAKKLIYHLSNNSGCIVGNNQPYHANDPRGYAQVAHGHERGVDFALLEIRQDLIYELAGQEKISGIIYEAVRPILESLHKEQHNNCDSSAQNQTVNR